jgi:twitching motility protein PilI
MNAPAASAPVTLATLRSLRDKPFELLRELERLARVALSGQGRDAANEREWVGVAFRMSAENFLVAREETREVLGFPA